MYQFDLLLKEKQTPSLFINRDQPTDRMNHLGPISWFSLPPNSALTITIRRLKALNFCASCAGKECLVTWNTPAHKPKFPAYTRNTLAVSTKYPASVTAVSVLTVSRAIILGPDFSPDACEAKNSTCTCLPS